MAWVDIKDINMFILLIYGITDLKIVVKRNLSLTNDQYNAIPSGSAMTSTDVCRNLDVDPKLYKIS